jgi:hypothetical protein
MTAGGGRPRASTRRAFALRLAAFVLAATTTLAAACEQGVVRMHDGSEYVVPAASPVHFVAEGEYGTARFEGTFVFSGTFHYGYVTDDPEADATYGLLVLWFVPDAATAKTLPYWKQRGAVQAIGLRNDEAFVAAMIAPATRAALAQRKVLSVSGRATLEVRAYRAMIECDEPGYTVEFVSLRPEGSDALVSRDLTQPQGC